MLNTVTIVQLYLFKFDSVGNIFVCIFLFGEIFTNEKKKLINNFVCIKKEGKRRIQNSKTFRLKGRLKYLKSSQKSIIIFIFGFGKLYVYGPNEMFRKREITKK